MQWIQRLSIRNKMLAAFMTIMLMADLGGGIALFNLARINAGTRALGADSMPRLRQAAALQAAVHDLRIAQYQAMLADEDADHKAAEADVANAIAAANALVATLSASPDAVEVRSLAQRSAQSAREIKSLIAQSVEVVHEGTGLVRDAGSTMQDMVVRADEVTSLIQGIFSATETQSGDIARLDQSIARINDVTHQNSALVEQSAAAAASLQAQGQRLGEAIAAFKT